RVSVVGAPSIAATVLLANPYPAIRFCDFLRAAHLLLDYSERLGARFTGLLRQDRETFQETFGFLESSGLVVRIEDGEGGILHVPDDKRINLDFHKNNSIHLFVVPSLVSHALLRGVSREGLRDEMWWWLDLFRNEFVLPERTELGDRVEEILECMRSLGMVGDGAVNQTDPILRSNALVLQNFREAYWVATRTVRSLDAAGKSEKALVGEMQRAYRAHLLLGVLRKPEGNTTVTLQNAVSRLHELGYVVFETRARGNRWVLPGPNHAALVLVESRLAESVTEPALRV